MPVSPFLPGAAGWSHAIWLHPAPSREESEEFLREAMPLLRPAWPRLQHLSESGTQSGTLTGQKTTAQRNEAQGECGKGQRKDEISPIRLYFVEYPGRIFNIKSYIFIQKYML